MIPLDVDPPYSPLGLLDLPVKDRKIFELD
jgi:hypothetical protein